MATDAWTPPFEPVHDAPAHDPATDAAAPTPSAPPAPTPSSVSSLSARTPDEQLSSDIKNIYHCLNVLKDFAFDPSGDPAANAKNLRLMLCKIPLHNTPLADPLRPAALRDSHSSTTEQRSLLLRLLHNLLRGDARAFITDNTDPFEVIAELRQEYALETEFDLQQKVQNLSFNDEGSVAKLKVQGGYLFEALDEAGLPQTEKAKRSHVLRALAPDRAPPELAFIYAQTAQQMSMPDCVLTWTDILNSVRRFLVTTNVTTAMAAGGVPGGRAYQTTTTTNSDPLVDAVLCEWCRRSGHSTSDCRNGQLAPSYATPSGPLTARLILDWADNIRNHRKNNPPRDAQSRQVTTVPAAGTSIDFDFSDSIAPNDLRFNARAVNFG